MLQLLGIGLGAALVGAVVMTLLDDEVQQQHTRWEREQARYRADSQAHRARIQTSMQQAALYQDYLHHVALHHASVQTADQCYTLYCQGKQLLQHLYEQLQVSTQKIVQLKQQRERCSASAVGETRAALQQQREIHAEIKRAITCYKQQLAENYQELTLLNQKTSELKHYIRDHTGKAGQLWYARRMQRSMTK